MQAAWREYRRLPAALASLLQGSRYRPAWVFAGVAAAFAVHVGLAIAAGSLLACSRTAP
jgi:putative Ca2+/H+ antiporter (TMEM165/GDT1 family)